MDKRLIKLLKINKSKSRPPIWLKKVIYTDDKGHSNADKMMLYNDTYKLSGKPDYILKTITNKYIPLEVKSSNIGTDAYPRENELMQLVTYFFLCEQNYKKPKYGYLIYKDYMFKIYNTKKLKKYYLKRLKDLHHLLETGEGMCEPSFTKCRYCVCKNTVCEFCDD